MRTLGNIISILREQSPVTLARELSWRVTRRRRKKNLGRLLQATPQVKIRNVPYFQPNLADVSDEQRRTILNLADGICNGRIPFLSYETQDLGLSPNWNADFVSGKEWPMESSYSLPVVRFDGSDIKVPWELSRLQFLPVLGKAYCLTRQARYRAAARQYVDDWINRNPVEQGVNWIVAMEVALRALSILFTVNLLWPLTNEEQEWKDKVTHSLWQHLVYIEANLEFSHILRGNHYLSNLVGLYGLAVFLDGPGMPQRRRRYQRLLEREILLHVYEDGGNYEASSGYHVLVAQIFLTAHQLMRADGATPAQDFLDRLRKMFIWMDSLADSKGRLPHVGDCDDGRVEYLLDDLRQMSVPVIARDSLRVASLLGLGKALLNAGSRGCPADAAWFGAQSNQSAGHSTLPEVRKLVLPQSGIAVAGYGRNDLLFLAVPNGIHGKGTHTHNDKLSVILRIDGEEVLCDPGTGCYTRDLATRNRFRSTAAHNTVSVDGEEQNKIPAGPVGFFSLGNQARVSQIETDPDSTRLWASHFGYADRGVVHTRSVEWTSANRIQIKDQFSGKDHHGLAVHFHAGPGWTISAAKSEGNVAAYVLERKRKVNLVFQSEGPLNVTQIPAAISWVFGTTVPSASLRMGVSAALPVSLVTDISWDE